MDHCKNMSLVLVETHTDYAFLLAFLEAISSCNDLADDYTEINSLVSTVR